MGAKRIYFPELMCCKARYLIVLTTMNCTIEAFLLLEGSLVLYGVPYERCPGDDSKSKRLPMRRMSEDGLKTLVEQADGFVVRMMAEKRERHVIPSGYVTVLASNDVSYLRWGISAGDSDAMRAQMILKHMLGSFPELRNKRCRSPISRHSWPTVR